MTEIDAAINADLASLSRHIRKLGAQNQTLIAENQRLQSSAMAVKVAELEEEIRQLRDEIGKPPVAIGRRFSRQQGTCLGVLLAHAGRPVRISMLQHAIRDTGDHRELPSVKQIQIIIHKIRRRLPSGVEIKNEFGVGYYVTKADAEKFAQTHA